MYDSELTTLDDAVRYIDQLKILLYERFEDDKEKERAVAYLADRYGAWVRVVAP